MIPGGPVKESDESNVTLFCNILDANPAVLTKVRWYANSTLLKELPDCDETRVSNVQNILYSLLCLANALLHFIPFHSRRTCATLNPPSCCWRASDAGFSIIIPARVTMPQAGDHAAKTRS